MPSLGRWERLARAMREDRRTCCVGSTFILSGLLMKVGLICFFLDNNNKATLYLFLSASSIWLFLICCGWTIRPSMNPFSNLLTCLRCSILLAIVLGLTALFVLLLWSAYNTDNTVDFDVSDAALTHFNLSGNNTTSTLNYNLTLKLTVGPNKKKAGVYYESLQAWVSYQGLNFTSLSLPPLYLGGKTNHTSNSSTVVLQPLVFQGQQPLVLPADALKRYRQDEADGRFSIDVAVSYLGFRGHPGPGHGHQLKGVATFALQELPLPNATSGWADGVDPLPGRVEGDIAGISVCAFLLLCFLCCCWGAAKERGYGTATCIVVCMLVPVITIAICVPDLVLALKKMDQVKLNVSNAILTQFNFTSSASTINSTTLSYNLSLAITIGPNHKKAGVYFNKLEAIAYYQGQNFTSLALPPFYLQGRQRYGFRTVILRPVFQGQQVSMMLPGRDGLTKYQEETAARQYSIVVTLSYWGIRIADYDYNNNSASADGRKQINGVATFGLKVPLLSTASGGY